MCDRDRRAYRAVGDESEAKRQEAVLLIERPLPLIYALLA